MSSLEFHTPGETRIPFSRKLTEIPAAKQRSYAAAVAPGAGMLEFELTPRADGGTRLTVTAYWHPAGVWGLLYWYLLAPAHWLIFRGLTRAISTRATAAERGRETH